MAYEELQKLSEIIKQQNNMSKILSNQELMRSIQLASKAKAALINQLPSLGKILASISELAKYSEITTAAYKSSLKNLSLQTQEIYKRSYFPENYLRFLELANSRIPSFAFVNKFAQLPDEFQLIDVKGEENTEYFIENKASGEQIISMVDSPVLFGIFDVIKSVDLGDVLSFYSYLAKYPLFGLDHQVGKEIYNAFKNFQDSDFYISDSMTLFKGRVWKENQSIDFTEKEMFEPPFGVPNMGRFNFLGQGNLYTCDDFDGTVMETTKLSGELLNVIEWEFTGGIKFLDLVGKDCPLIDYCLKPVEDDKCLFKKEYLVSNYLSQCCLIHKIDGIRYRSTKNKDAICYVFFDPQEKWFEFKKLHSVNN